MADNICCYSALSLVRTAAAMSGVKPLTSPPVFLRDFDHRWLEGRQLIFFKLHGLRGQPYWYGDGLVSAISADQVRQADLGGALVFAANCFGLGSPMVAALLAAGARAVIAGANENTAGRSILLGADVIGLWWRRLVQRGLEAGAALTWAKRATMLRNPKLREDIESFAVVGEQNSKLIRREPGGNRA